MDKAKAHKIHIWNEQLIEYYKNLIKDIGKYTTFNLFGEMGINPPEEKLIRKPALKIKIRNHILYSLFMNPEELLECSYVARRERGKTEFYQRVLRRQRLSNIAKEFIIKEKGMFPNNIIISLGTGSKFIPINQPQDLSEEIEFGILQFPKRYISCKIIDGQHRLYSFAKTHIHFPLPVTAFKNIKDLEEMKFFVDINEKQKSIDSNLIWDLYGDLHPGSPRGIISRCVKRINEVEPFFDKNNGIRNYNVYVPLKGGKKTGDINLSGLCDSIKKTGLARKHTRTLKRKINALFHKNDNTMIHRVSINLSKYFSCIDKILSDDAKDFIFHVDGGMSVMIFLFEKLFARFKGKIEEDEIIKYIKSLKSFFDKEDIDEIKSRCTSEEQKDNVVNDFLYHLALDLDDEILEKFVKITKYDEDIKEFERKLGKCIKLILEKEDKAWIKHRVDGNISKRSKIRFEGRIPEDPRKEIHEFFTLGEERSIIERNDN